MKEGKIEEYVLFDRNSVKTKSPYRLETIQSLSKEQQEIFKTLWTPKFRTTENPFFSDQKNFRFMFKINHPVQQSSLDNLLTSVNNQFNLLVEDKFKRNFLAAHEAIVEMYPDYLVNKEYFEKKNVNAKKINFLTAEDVKKDKALINNVLKSGKKQGQKKNEARKKETRPSFCF